MVTEKCVNELSRIITKIVNLSFINEKFPDALKSALIIPLIKKQKLGCNLRGKIQSAYKLCS